MNSYPRILLAGTHSGVGKTTLTIGLLLALKKKGLRVQPYKAGPDYIDSGFHTKIAGLPCRNLDSFLLSRDVILELFERQSRKASFSLIEGVMGLFDGLKADSDIGSTAHIAKILNCPTILILDVGKMSRSAAAMALGYKRFDARLNLAGFILNQVGSPSHYQMVKQTIESKTGLPVLGYLPKDKTLILPERHLGLTPVKEIPIYRFYRRLGSLMEKSVDINAVIKIGENAAPLPVFKKTIFHGKSKPLVNMAVAYDKCFHFYYQDNLDILEHLGARLKFFSPLKSKRLPANSDGIYIGGGFPEVFASELARNKTLRRDIKIKSREGMPIYAECGGLMYLMDRLVDFEGRRFSMVGVFPGVVKMDTKLRRLGYARIKSLSDNILGQSGSETKGHIFHWSYIEKMPGDVNFAFEIERKGQKYHDGFLKKNTLAAYTHLHFGSSPLWARNFVSRCLLYRKEFLSPEEIEKKSFKIIERELGILDVSREESEIIKRLAHATADPEFARGIIFHPQAIEKGILALKSGRDIITDVEMVKAGIRIKELKAFGNKIFCFLNNKRVLEKARHEGLPRAVLAMRQAIPRLHGNIVVIGNAPTALFELVNLIKKGKVSPALIIGIPVGFVGAKESKEALRKVSIPYITNEGRRGGSAAACAIINALIKLAVNG